MRRTSFRSAPLGPDFLTDLAHEQIRRAAGLRGPNALGGVLEDDRVGGGNTEVLHSHKEAVRRGLFVRDLDIRQQQVANAYLFLASDLASYVTGEILSVDGAAQT